MIAESFERIHRSNLVGMGVLPLEFFAGDSGEELGLTGEEDDHDRRAWRTLERRARPSLARQRRKDGRHRVQVRARIDTHRRAKYYRHGGILRYVLRDLLA